MELLNDFPQFGSGEDLLGQTLDALVGKAGYRGADELRGYLLVFDENGSFRLIDGGQ